MEAGTTSEALSATIRINLGGAHSESQNALRRPRADLERDDHRHRLR